MSSSLKVLALVLALASTCHAGADYYSDSGKGWWWYDRDKPADEERQDPKPKRQASTPAPPENEYKTRNPSLKNFSYQQLWDMHPDDFYELQESFKKKAVQNASEENVMEYYEIIDIARKKGLAFTNSSMYVWQKYPELTTGPDNPTTAPGALAETTMKNEERQAKLKNYKDEFALIYFTQQGCTYCTEQTKILNWFKSQTGWSIRPVDIHENTELANRLGVTITPTLILIQKGNEEFFPVSAGVMSAADIEDRTYRAIRILAKEITPEQYSIYDFQKGGGYDTEKKDFPTTKKRREKKP